MMVLEGTSYDFFLWSVTGRYSHSEEEIYCEKANDMLGFKISDI